MTDASSSKSGPKDTSCGKITSGYWSYHRTSFKSNLWTESSRISSTATILSSMRHMCALYARGPTVQESHTYSPHYGTNVLSTQNGQELRTLYPKRAGFSHVLRREHLCSAMRSILSKVHSRSGSKITTGYCDTVISQ